MAFDPFHATTSFGDEASPSRPPVKRKRVRRHQTRRAGPTTHSGALDDPRQTIGEPIAGPSGTGTGTTMSYSFPGDATFTQTDSDAETIIISSSGTRGQRGRRLRDDVVIVSSPSLAKILHARNVDRLPSAGYGSSAHAAAEEEETHGASASAGSLSACASASVVVPPPASPDPEPESDPEPEAEAEAEPLSEYTCPICFFPPTNATLTPCGHVCCGSCLFTAVQSTMQRAASMARDEANVARCLVCRAGIAGWDGKGAGVIGLRPRAVIAL